MPNDNCLRGTRCPKCKSEGPFLIASSAIFEIHDDGTEGYEGVEWSDENSCLCKKCKHQSTVLGFKKMTDEEHEEYVRIIVQACYDDPSFLRSIVEDRADEAFIGDYLLWTELYEGPK